MKKKLFTNVLFFVAIFILLVACNDAPDASSEVEGNENENEGKVEEREDITLTIMMWDNWGQNYEKYIKEAVEDEFPHITLENVGGDTGNKEWIEETLAAHIIPDFIFAHRQYHVKLLEEFELAYDMTELLELHDFDLSRYNPAHIDEWKSWSNDEIWLLPFMRDIYALQYNKEIFDLFGVEYPTDGMTWNEVINLAEQVSGEMNDIQYQGLDFRHTSSHLAITQIMGEEQLIDPETHEVLWVDNPYVKEYLEMVERAHSNPTNVMPDQDPWEELGTLALRPLWLEMATQENTKVDMVTFPQWEDAPNIGPLAGGWGIGITEPSEHKSDAMEVLKFLYSDDHIIHLGASPIHAPFDHLYVDQNIDDLLEGVEDERLEKFKGTNLQALYQLEPAGGPKSRSEFDVGAFNEIVSLSKNFLESGSDVNTFIRELKEKEEIRVQEEIGNQ